MATEIKVPALGESVTEATIGKWFKKPGDAVKADEPLVELETDKVTLEVNAPAAACLARSSSKPARRSASVPAWLDRRRWCHCCPCIRAGRSFCASRNTRSGRGARSGSPAMPPSPAAAKIAADRGLNPAQIEGSGRRASQGRCPHGRSGQGSRIDGSCASAGGLSPCADARSTPCAVASG